MTFTANPPEHGTERGYQQHRYAARKARRNGNPEAVVEACEACKAAHYQHHRTTQDQPPAEVLAWRRDSRGVLRAERRAA